MSNSIKYSQLAAFIEYAAKGSVTQTEWQHFIVTHYPDKYMEHARRECVRILSIKGNGNFKNLDRADLDYLYSIAEDLRKMGTN